MLSFCRQISHHFYNWLAVIRPPNCPRVTLLSIHSRDSVEISQKKMASRGLGAEASSKDGESFAHSLVDAPTVGFHSNLRKHVEVGGVRIPIIIAVPMMALLKKHDEELACGYSFLQDENFESNFAGEFDEADLAGVIQKLSSQDVTESSVESLLENYDAAAIFRLLIRILRRFETKPFPLSIESCQIISDIDFFNKDDPVMRGNLKIWEKDQIGMELEESGSFADCEMSKECKDELTRNYINDDWWQHCIFKGMNMILSCLFRDEFMIVNQKTRLVLNFILTNLNELVYSYVRSLYKTDIMPNTAILHVAGTVIFPIQVKRMICRIARTIGPLLFRVEKSWAEDILLRYPYCLDEIVGVLKRAITDMQTHVMKNILCVHHPRFWNYGEKLETRMIHDRYHDYHSKVCACHYFENPSQP